jgi:Flp pilus assembly pilin Flp
MVEDIKPRSKPMKSLPRRAAAWALGLLHEDRAQDMIEYALMAAAVAVAAGAIMPPVANHMTEIFSKVTSLVGRTPG